MSEPIERLLPASLSDVLDVLQKILPGPEDSKNEPNVPREVLNYKPMSPVEALCYSAHRLDEQQRYAESSEMLQGAIRETFISLINTLNHLATVRDKAGDQEGALDLYVQGIRLADYFGLERHCVIGNCALQLLEMEQTVPIPWAEQVYDLWMEELAEPGAVEEGRDTWMIEAFERVGRSRYAAIVRDLGV